MVKMKTYDTVFQLCLILNIQFCKKLKFKICTICKDLVMRGPGICKVEKWLLAPRKVTDIKNLKKKLKPVFSKPV